MPPLTPVIYSPGYGAGWYSWHGIPELLHDVKLARMIEGHTPTREIEERIAEITDEYVYPVRLADLEVLWLEPGTPFEITEYDGSEGVRVNPKYMIAPDLG